MDENLFVNLVKYAPKVGSTSLENFTTQLLAYLIENIESLRLRFFKLLDLSESNTTKDVKSKLNIQTQKVDNGIIPDLSITDDEKK